jgi:hypothetical protein
MIERPVKITFGEMREMGVRGVLIYCADYRRSHSVAAALINGRMIFGYPILSLVLSAGPAAIAARPCGRISTGQDGDSDDGLGNLNRRPALISSSPVPCPLYRGDNLCRCGGWRPWCVSIRIPGRLCLGRIPMRHYVKMGTLPKLVHSGRVLMHNHVRHSKDMPCGPNGFRAWTDNMPPRPVSSPAGAAGLACRTTAGFPTTSACRNRCFRARPVSTADTRSAGESCQAPWSALALDRHLAGRVQTDLWCSRETTSLNVRLL